MSKVTCLLRAYRLKSGLTQQELTALVPGAGHNRVSDIEQNGRLPNVREILSYQLIFCVLSEKIFPGLVKEVEEGVARGAYKLHAKLAKDTSKEAAHKRAFLDGVMERVLKQTRRREK